MTSLVAVYGALSDIYLKGSWIGEAVKRRSADLTDKASLRLIYSVVEREFLMEYRIARLTERPPKSAVKLLLKMGMCLVDTFNYPDQAAVNEIVETAKKVGKGGVGGFVNAVLRRYVKEGKDMYPTDPDELLSVRSGRPLWLVKRYLQELGRREAENRLNAKQSVMTHVRPSISFGKEALRVALSERSIAFQESAYGFFIGEVGGISDLLSEGKATVMSQSSLDVCASIPCKSGPILDLCAAPGGKSVYLAERFRVDVVACDLYPHRVDLIEKYASRMRVSGVKPTVWDGRVYREEWKDAFSIVLLDAPCSGFGSLASNRDVVLHRTEKDLSEIVKTQKQLLSVASKYVASGGALVYATCSDLPSEDEEVVRTLLEKNADFTLESEKYTDPATGGGECYYCAVLRKR